MIQGNKLSIHKWFVPNVLFKFLKKIMLGITLLVQFGNKIVTSLLFLCINFNYFCEL